MNLRNFPRTTRRAFVTLREDGISTLATKSLDKLRETIEWRLAVRRSVLVQSVENAEIRFRVRNKDEYGLTKIKAEDELLVRELASELTDGQVFFDVGSAIGSYAITIAKTCPGVDVVTFEPNPSNFRLLKENVDLNGVSIETKQIALSDCNETVSVGGDNPTGAAQIASDRTASGRSSIAARRGDDIVSELGQVPDVLKIDVEGAESLVVEGLRDTLQSRDVRLLYCEVHRPHSGSKITDYGSTPSEFEEELRALGFDIEVLRDPHPEWNYFIKASK